jgi:hypothetical protein
VLQHVVSDATQDCLSNLSGTIGAQHQTLGAEGLCPDKDSRCDGCLTINWQNVGRKIVKLKPACQIFLTRSG